MLLSIIVISYNEEKFIGESIKSIFNALKFNCNNKLSTEIILSDGGSTDATIQIAKPFVDKIVISPLGRYIQLNKGAKEAKGDVFLFLHSDTKLPENAFFQLEKNMNNSLIIGGGFQKNWEWSKGVKISKLIRLINWLWIEFGNWTVRLIKTFPGDNAIFVQKEVFFSLGGFSPLLICEDFDFLRRLKRYCKKNSKKITCINVPVITSARRFEEKGYFKTLFNWFYIYSLWWFGLSPSKLNNRFQNYSFNPLKS
ncbi:MAG: glycosyltransferase family 2 protein [Candidatus Lokiarchaeota archaeon]|nr:glycosyltransferase family 2 protein [Candidatus Lokiarchaeota archaeon]